MLPVRDQRDLDGMVAFLRAIENERGKRAARGYVNPVSVEEVSLQLASTLTVQGGAEFTPFPTPPSSPRPLRSPNPGATPPSTPQQTGSAPTSLLLSPPQMSLAGPGPGPASPPSAPSPTLLAMLGGQQPIPPSSLSLALASPVSPPPQSPPAMLATLPMSMSMYQTHSSAGTPQDTGFATAFNKRYYATSQSIRERSASYGGTYGSSYDAERSYDGGARSPTSYLDQQVMTGSYDEQRATGDISPHFRPDHQQQRTQLRRQYSNPQPPMASEELEELAAADDEQEELYLNDPHLHHSCPANASFFNVDTYFAQAPSPRGHSHMPQASTPPPDELLSPRSPRNRRRSSAKHMPDLIGSEPQAPPLFPETGSHSSPLLIAERGNFYDLSAAASAAAAEEPPPPMGSPLGGGYHSYSTPRMTASDTMLWRTIPQGQFAQQQQGQRYAGKIVMQQVEQRRQQVTSPRATPPNYSDDRIIVVPRPKRNPPHQDYDRLRFAIRIENGTIRDPRTTLMIKNIPNKYTQKMLLDSINKNHASTYDFFYLPIDFKNKCNVGYAFINMVDNSKIAPLFHEFSNRRWDKFNSEKICEIAYARIQGLTQLVEHFKSSSLLAEEEKVRPIMLLNGELQPFPVGVTLHVITVPAGGSGSGSNGGGFREIIVTSPPAATPQQPSPSSPPFVPAMWSSV
eukprot:TRINITY_DN187_c0_g1_i3.p1 TRINITY_DN187_c0_g1~~TRINITY_DN187_c0_g1_i3.p1  ORF type:complete len:752 (-),score=207.65 TRINITY_DN187_c0_g1_i3:121-2172(-)